MTEEVSDLNAPKKRRQLTAAELKAHLQSAPPEVENSGLEPAKPEDKSGGSLLSMLKGA